MNCKRIGKTIVESVVIVLSIVTLNFFLIRFMPGDAVMHIIGEDEYQRLVSTDPEAVEAIRASYGLDRSLPEQYAAYLGKILHLDFGNSYRTKSPVMETVLFRMSWTLALAVPATILAALIGGILGLLAGYRSSPRFDFGVSGAMLVLLGIPANCLAILFLLLFSFRLGWFPIGGLTSGGLSGVGKLIDILWHMVLPMSVLTLLKIPSDFMLMKSTVSSLKDEEYLIVARSRGFTRIRVLRRHLLKNTLCPYLTSLCVQFGQILAGSMLVEVVFSWKGMGTLIYDSVNGKDFPMLQTSVLFICICVVICNILADILNQLIDPRLREVRHE